MIRVNEILLIISIQILKSGKIINYYPVLSTFEDNT